MASYRNEEHTDIIICVAEKCVYFKTHHYYIIFVFVANELENIHFSHVALY